MATIFDKWKDYERKAFDLAEGEEPDRTDANWANAIQDYAQGARDMFENIQPWLEGAYLTETYGTEIKVLEAEVARAEDPEAEESESPNA